ncbi:phosphotransferase [Halorubellus sp. JP-L1]|uniref:phosphotransferase family protein n=1 Tax=Halorubellus sp. JP-L1 TaxID=2715753 RepID=UPI00140B0707|nr:phosphotransferase [Halorubellus sp. JP-L1]
MTEVNIDDDDGVVVDALAAAFPDREVATVGEAGLSWNEGNRTVRVEFAAGDGAYLKVAVDGDGSRAATEAAGLSYANAHTDAAVPTVLARDLDRDRPYLATADVDSSTAEDTAGVHSATAEAAPAVVGWRAWRNADDDERAALARGLGRTLASVHACRFDDHGHVVGGDADGLDLDRGAWTDVLLDTIDFTREQAGDGRFAHHFDAVVELVEAGRDRLDRAPAALLHGDPARPNTFVRDATAGAPDAAATAPDATATAPDATATAPDATATAPDVDGTPTVGLLDWELAHVGDPVRELQRANRQFVTSTFDPGTDRHVDAFYDGYRERADGLPDGFDDRHRIYDAVAYLGVSGFFEKWEREFETSTDEIAADVREEMDRRLDAAWSTVETAPGH